MKRFGLLIGILIAAAFACSLPGAGQAPVEGGLPGAPSLTPPQPGEPAPTVVSTGAAPTQPVQTPGQALVPGALSVAYVKDGGLWLWAQGQARLLVQSDAAFAPVLSPDGKVAAYLKRVDDFHAELWAVNNDGSNDRRLVGITDLDTIGGGVRDPNAAAINPYQYEWAPGTHTLAFNTYQVFQGPGLAPLDDLHLVDADSGTITNLLLNGWGGNFSFSPDGKQIALSTPSQVNLVNADGSNWRTVLTYLPVNTYSEYRYYAQPAWSQDGTALRCAIPPVDPLAQPTQPTALWLIPLDGTPAQQEGSLAAVPFFDTPVLYSPDLSSLIYLQESGAPAENRRELMIAKWDGSGAWAYQKAVMLRTPAWAPDSQHFSFISGEEQAAWLGRLDAPAAPFLDDPGGIREVRWISASQALFMRDEGGLFSLYFWEEGLQPVLVDSATQPPAFDWVLPQ